MIEFRALTADEVECRVGVCKQNGLSLLLYKDARVDMSILDETVGAMNWQRYHSRDNANCTISIWDEDKKQWVSKEDTGTESNTEKEKGLASDSFKRAGTNWGIGRELYTAPFIWVDADNATIKQKEGSKAYTTNDKFSVSELRVENGVITGLVIRNDNKNKTVFTFGSVKTNNEKPHLSKDKQQEIMLLIAQTNADFGVLLETYKVKSLGELSEASYKNIKDILTKRLKKE